MKIKEVHIDTSKIKALKPQASSQGSPEENEILLYNDRREYRLKKKKSKRRRNIAMLLVLFAAALIYLNWDILSPSVIGNYIGDFIDNVGKSKYPVTLSQGNYLGSVPMGNNLGVLTDTAFLIYSPSGSEYAERPHGMANPAVVSDGGWAVMFDRGGRQFKEESRFKENYTGQTANSIITAAVSSSGDFAVVTESDRYLGEVWVYDRNGKVIFQYFSAEGRILSVSLSPSGQKIAIDQISAQNGDMVSTVKLFWTDNKKQIGQKPYPGVLMYNVRFKNNNAVTAVGDSSAAFLDGNCKEISRYNYDDKTLKCYSNTSDGTALAFSKYSIGSESTIVSLNESGKVLGKADVASNISAVFAGNDRISALTQKSIWHSALDCKNIQTVNAPGDALGMMTIKNNVYIFGLETVYQYRSK